MKLLTKLTAFVKHWPEYRKALGGFIGSLLAGGVAVLALGVLGDVQAGYVAAAIAFLGPIGAWLGAYTRKPNDTPTA